MRAITIAPSGDIEEVSVENLEDLQAILGGNIEQVPAYIEGACVFCHELGKVMRLPVNKVATLWLSEPLGENDWIAGTVIVVGLDHATGEERDLPASITAESIRASVTNLTQKDLTGWQKFAKLITTNNK